MVIGTMDKIGSVLGQDQDNFVMVPLSVFLKMKGIHSSLTINVKAGKRNFEQAQDEAQLILRARRHLTPGMENDFFTPTKQSYMALCPTITPPFFPASII